MYRNFFPVSFGLLVFAATAVAQPTLNHPDQFYSNGEKVNAWTVNKNEKLMSTFWFVKNPKKSLNYQQQIAIVYDNEPDQIYYFSAAEKKFIGRFDIEEGAYSLLKPADRRAKRSDIPSGAFPPPDGLPKVGEMFPLPPPGEEANNEEMMMPPPTMQHPQFEQSEWDSFYATPNNGRQRAKIKFNGDVGTYKLAGSNSEGELSEVVYEMQANSGRFEIRGRWQLGQARGFFRFRVPMDDLFVFSGFSSQNRNASDGGIWDAVRTK